MKGPGSVSIADNLPVSVIQEFEFYAVVADGDENVPKPAFGPKAFNENFSTYTAYIIDKKTMTAMFIKRDVIISNRRHHEKNIVTVELLRVSNANGLYFVVAATYKQADFTACYYQFFHNKLAIRIPFATTKHILDKYSIYSSDGGNIDEKLQPEESFVTVDNIY
ncbi:hypothetical protein BDC45DRAFT_555110 [Circinella umbellata]|nr:hypothetical protein BDC45DRAFT_555110 [Circinella umbellata]